MKQHSPLLVALLLSSILPLPSLAQTAQPPVQAAPPGTPFPLPPANWPQPVMDNQPTTFLLLDRLEVRSRRGSDARLWSGQAWFGGDYNKLWLKTEGEQAAGRTQDAEVQLLIARLIQPFWNLQAGVRYQARPGPSRSFGVIALQGLAPYQFEVGASLFLRGGKVSARVEAEYDQLLTQRLILQPGFEANLAGSSDAARGVGSGVTDMELGLRLRYEIRREIAPYVGVSWARKFGGTADFARRNGERVADRSVMVGLRLWY